MNLVSILEIAIGMANTICENYYSFFKLKLNFWLDAYEIRENRGGAEGEVCLLVFGIQNQIPIQATFSA